MTTAASALSAVHCVVAAEPGLGATPLTAELSPTDPASVSPDRCRKALIPPDRRMTAVAAGAESNLPFTWERRLGALPLVGRRTPDASVLARRAYGDEKKESIRGGQQNVVTS